MSIHEDSVRMTIVMHVCSFAGFLECLLPNSWIDQSTKIAVNRTVSKTCIKAFPRAQTNMHVDNASTQIAHDSPIVLSRESKPDDLGTNQLDSTYMRVPRMFHTYKSLIPVKVFVVNEEHFHLKATADRLFFLKTDQKASGSAWKGSARQ